LVDGGEVRFNGIKVGEVKSMRVDERDSAKIVARVQVSGDTPLRQDSVAELEAVGLTGVTLIQLHPGSKAAPLLVPKLGAGPPRIASVVSVVDTIATRDNAQRLTEILVNLRSISAELAGENSVVAESARTARDLAETARAVTALSRDAKSSLAAFSTRADRSFANMDVAVDHASDAFQRLEGAALVAETQSLPQLSKAAEGVQRLSSAAADAIDDFEESPSAFVAGQSRPRIRVPK
jgi:phospholipid/cholesterol/gamma-HCH transport system substrate-binding protein